jgi:hypothetical protein
MKNAMKPKIDKEKMLAYMQEMDGLVMHPDFSISDFIEQVTRQVKDASHPTEYALAFLGIRDKLLYVMAESEDSGDAYILFAGSTAIQTLNIIALAYAAECQKNASNN